MISNKQSQLRVAFAIALSVSYILWAIYSIDCRTESDNLGQPHEAAAPKHLPCRGLPGSDETLTVLRTGATELDDRLAVHLSTSLRCSPNYLIFSDLEEDYSGEHIIDALADVSPTYQQNSTDFELWRRLRAGGRSALDPSELAGSPDRFANMGGKADNPGWKLDKWKFLPMINRTLHERPDFKWYVFIEADSFLLWSQLQQYLATLEPTDLIYAGSQMFISGVLFAHGGSGFIVSQSAMQKVVDHYSAHKAEIEEFTDGHWAGDCVLGKAFTDAGVPFTNAWPAIQGDYPGLVPYARADGRSVLDESLREWCYPTISYHHMSPGMTQQLWSFEQQWMMEHNATIDMLRHKDVFTDFVMPQMMSPRDDWENLSDQEEGILPSVDECRACCIAQPDCRQYSFDPDGMCRTRVDPRLGKARRGFQSGWIEDRIVDFERSMAPCGSESWPV
ncbi:glycosyltransferase family 31 protein [Hortaea werneckii]|nr:glycosyltransferase family 31 protein [Hortaea werneckii]KAI7095044.1 glycosyltransferase family 31 protein [Hortaea werneckii]KAI7234331.1 glycosyltransferase family 31 protein [Hortaea werneckii]KAI7315306.1 glycosyltransferase family 31 protein [Hortaea werneckii]KAI7401007.1 glycosyltransferase family 31 protein [Hortaea werneckii]